METFENIVERLMKCEKRTLAEMIALQELSKKLDNFTQPNIPQYTPPVIDPLIFRKDYITCTDWSHCTNPYRDCINCPIKTTGGTWPKITYTTTTTKTNNTEKEN